MKLRSMNDCTQVPTELLNTTTLAEEGAVDLFIEDTIEELYPITLQVAGDAGPFLRDPMCN